MAAGYVQAVTGTTGTTGTTLGLPSMTAVSSGNSVIVLCIDFYPSVLPDAISVTDDQSNTYTLDWTSSAIGSNNVRLKAFSAHNVTNAPTDVTVTYDTTVDQNQSACAFEVSGLSGTAGNNNTTTASSATAVSLAASATEAESFYCGHFHVPFRGLSVSNETDALFAEGNSFEYFYGIPAGSGSNTCGATWSSGSDAEAHLIIYEASTGGGGSSALPLINAYYS